MAVAQPKTIQAPKVHPSLIGGSFGIAVAILQVLAIQLNHTSLNQNKIVGFVGSVLLPVIALYLAGHYAGRHQRLNVLETKAGITESFRSVAAGTGAGAVTGLVYVLLTELSPLVEKFLPYTPGSNGLFGDVLGVLGNIGGFIVWLFLGLVLGTIGGYFGDSRAHKQLKSGVVVAK